MSIYLDHAPRGVSSRPLFTATALLTAAALAGGGFYLVGRGGADTTVVAGVAPVVRAPVEPVKIKPVADAANPGAPEASRVAAAKPGRETKTDGKPFAPLNTRVVKTIAIRPDGSLVEPQAAAETQKRAAGAREALATGPATAAVTPVATSVATPLAATPAPVQAAARPAAALPEPAVAKASTRVDTTPVASIRPPAPVVAAPAAALAAAPGAGFAVQLAAAPTEDEARRLAQRFQALYSDNLGRRDLTVREGVVKDKPVYRVRLADLSKEEATAVCARLRGGNAACFVARD